MLKNHFARAGICIAVLFIASLQAQAQVPPSAESGIITRSLERPDRPRARL